MVSKILLVVLTVLSFSSAFADRGGWVSNGGEIFRFDRNPWFVKNVTQVRYCVRTEDSTLSVGRGAVREAFRGALAYWKSEFGSLRLPTGAGLIKVGDQEFVETDCPESREELDRMDLIVKVGYGTLDKEEIEFLTRSENASGGSKKIETYIGVSIRKDYDFKRMQGRGVIFIASDLGEHSYKNDGQFVERAWSQSKLLQYAFMHELGHLFGIPHSGAGLMSEVFLDQMLNKRMSGFYSAHPLQPFLSSPRDFEVCTFSGTFNPKFFQLKETTACLVLRQDQAAGSEIPRWKIFAKKYSSSEPVELGAVRLENPVAKVNSARPAVTVQLPDEQQVFSLNDRGFASFMIGGIFSETDYQGFFQTSGSLKPYPLFANLRTDSVTFMAVMDGKLIPVLTYAPPTVLQMLIPIGAR